MKYHLIALSAFAYFNNKHLEKLLFYFDQNAESAWNAREYDYLCAGLPKKLVAQFLDWRKTFDVEKIILTMDKENISCITQDSERYPTLLKQIPDPPLLLFIRGVLPKEQNKKIAIVGARKATSYGITITTQITKELARSGVTIVSGMALGIDAVAHRAALEACGSTMAVLGGGINNDSTYPRTNYRLAHQIIDQGGAVISEFAPCVKPDKHHFPLRNRIVAGLSHGVLVTEGSIKSGSLITARAALEDGREVFACPHNIFTPLGEGPNSLIQVGAHTILCADDILSILGIEKPDVRELTGVSVQEKKIISCCRKESKTLDKLARDLALSISEMNILITGLEIKGLVQVANGVIYYRG